MQPCAVKHNEKGGVDGLDAFTTVAFFAIQIGTVYAPNMSGLLGLRFLAGLIGAPSLGCKWTEKDTIHTDLPVGGASIGDMGGGVFFSRLILVWALGAVMGPTIGPVIGGFAFEWAGWKGTIWYAYLREWGLWLTYRVTVMVAGVATVAVLSTMPESSVPTVSGIV